MAKIWFRYHADVLNNKRVQKLPAELFKLWVNCQSILAMENAPASGRLPPTEDCAYMLRMSVEETANKFDKLVEAGMFMKRNETKCNENETESETEEGVFEEKNSDLFETLHVSIYFVKKWGEKQYKSDVSTDRVRKHRDKKRNVPETVNVTPPDQIRSDTDTDQIEGSFHSEKNDKKKSPTRYSIDMFLKDEDRARARASSQGWDQQALMVKFNEFIIGKVKEYPNHPAKAYIAWVKKYTKGKPPI